MQGRLQGPTGEQIAQLESRGYFVVRNVIPREVAMEVRGVIRNAILTPEASASGGQADPMDPMGDTPAARAARFRKLDRFCRRSPLIWHEIHTNPRLLGLAAHYLGGDVLLKFDSCFLKPAQTGSATPWHQDNGLWRDGETEPFNFWMAIDPATRENGCMQFIPGSHQGEIVPHVLYADSIHGELPREKVREMIERHGLDHIELDPGDAVCWHSNLYHYSPPNRSDKGRMAVAGVYSSPKVAERSACFKRLLWVLRGGEVCDAFPPEEYVVGDGGPPVLAPHPRVEEAVATV